MAKVGYIFKANSYDALDADKEWMRQYGCVQVVEEECAHEALRPQWKQLMASLGRGDELVVAKFSNAVRDLRGLAALVELCRIKVVRLVSIHDKIDTLGELFPDTTAAQVLEMFGALPEEVAVLRKSSSHIMQLQQTIKPPVTKKAMSRAEREKTIVDMYNNGYPIDDIWKMSGFNSKSSIWRILNKYGVWLNRGRTSGPRVKKQHRGRGLCRAAQTACDAPHEERFGDGRSAPALRVVAAQHRESVEKINLPDHDETV